MPAIERPGADEYLPYYAGYVDRVGGEVLARLADQLDELEAMLRPLPPAGGDFAFAPGEWSVKEVVGHLVDAERAFSYRAFAFSRGETATLPSFDQDEYVRQARFGVRPLGDLLEELALLRRASLIAFRHLDAETSRRRGVAGRGEISVRALIYVLAGHLDYHLEDLRTKYLPALAAAGP